MVKAFDYKSSLQEIKIEILEAVDTVLESGQLVLGPETTLFEKEFAEFVGVRHCIAVSSGTTALYLSLWACGVGQGDEVITVGNTCAPTAAAIRQVGARPVFVDVRESDLLIDPKRVEAAMTKDVRCILPVHLWGLAAPIEELRDIADRYNICLIEDCAQAHGTLVQGRQVGVFGRAGCFSFYPTKNLGAYGDAGAVVTNDDDLADRLRAMRVYGYDSNRVSQLDGMNARINEMQAAILRVKLRVFPKWLEKRLATAEFYRDHIARSGAHVPQPRSDSRSSYHQFVIRDPNRDYLAKYLKSQGVDVGIHYPVPLHHMPAFRKSDARGVSLPVTEQAANEILSLPCHEALSREDAEKVVDAVNSA